jgi:hypothetical protein
MTTSSECSLEISGAVSTGVLQSVTRDAFTELKRVDGLEVELTQAERVKGNKGDPITLGVLAMTLIKGGAAVAIIRAIEKIFLRDKKLKVKLKIGSQALEMEAHNLSSAEREKIRVMIEEFAAREHGRQEKAAPAARSKTSSTGTTQRRKR